MMEVGRCARQDADELVMMELHASNAVRRVR